MSLFIKEFTLWSGKDPSEPEIGPDCEMKIARPTFLGRSIGRLFRVDQSTKVFQRDCVSGSDRGWQPISLEDAGKLLRDSYPKDSLVR